MSDPIAGPAARLEVDTGWLTQLALDLISLRSLSGEEGRVAGAVHAAMTDLGFDVTIDRLGNVIGTLDAGPGPCVLLDSHINTVGVTDVDAWKFDPAGELADGRIYGRGAMDMKGQLAASIHGIAALRDSLAFGRVVVSATVAEEYAEGPALMAVIGDVEPDAVIICESSSLRLAHAQRGRAEITVTVDGRSSHSARPELAINAAEAMVDVIRRVRDLHLPDHAVLGTGILVLTDVVSRPYPGLSVIPNRCVATYDRRTLPGETHEDVLAQIREIVDAVVTQRGATGAVAIAVDHFSTYTGEGLELENFAPAWETASDSPLIEASLAALSAAGLPAETTTWAFCTNGSGSAGRLGLPTIGYGPGEEGLAHCVDEHIVVDDLIRGARGYATLAPAILTTLATA